MKWLPRSKKHWIIIVALVLAAAGAGFFIIRSGDDDTEMEEVAVSVETKVADIFAVIGQDETYSGFKDFLGDVNFATDSVANEAGVTPKLVVFAPNNAAFEKDDVTALKDVPAAVKNELRTYHAAALLPAADGTGPNMDLSDGQKIATLSGRELHVKKVGSKVYLVDVKGREAAVSASYSTDDAGNRLYTIDSVLLLQ